MTKYLGIAATAYGKVSGTELGGRYAGITLFKGIPYAAPPVGELRWQAPREVQGWDGVRECTSYAPVCVQPTGGDLNAEPWATDFYFAGSRPMSEDCLYLNIATGAASADERRPVFVWFHGGGSDHGYSYEVEFDPRELARKGVVVVSVAQRLSMFGYLTLPQLSAEQGGKSGNYILMDNKKALQWVIDNIAAFGGDPDTITVGGQSAGSMKSAMAAFTSIAPGHVKRVINQSSLVWKRKVKTLEQAQQECARYLEEIGIDPTLPVDELRKIDPYRFLPPKDKNIRIPGPLVYDGTLVPDPDLADTMERFGSVYDYLAGSNLGETHMRESAGRGERDFSSAAEFYAFCRKLLGRLYDEYDFEKLVPVTDENAERVSRALVSLGLYEGERMGNLTVNRLFGKHRAKTAHGKKTFTYLFTRVAPSRPEDRGTDRDPDALMSWHSNELWYTFASLREDVPPARPWEPRDYELADQMSGYWANFIKTGDVNGEGLPHWPESGDMLAFAALGDEIKTFNGLGRLDELILRFLDSRRGVHK